ncbi:MAG: aminotransferase class I/II-fold pyridoxal phosphate-dependent enzyme [Chloroflexi bacterium]|nr:aminotransferase class I/II-fold pyridoxal phosphate-dependent enzyme [Chloroflexota bacterium]
MIDSDTLTGRPMTFRSVAKSGTLSLNEMMAALEASGRQVYKFGFGESPFSPPPRVQAALQAARGRAEYTAVAGLPELREKIAAFHCEIDGYPIGMSQVLVAPGTKPLLYNVMQAFQNAEIYLPEPSWVSYAPQASIAGHCVNRVPTSWENRWRVVPSLLDEIITRHGRTDRAKLMLLNYPGNPDGLTYTRPELLALSEVLREHGVWVVSDEIYGLLHHRGEHVSLASLYPERTLVTTGLSKWCGAGGWRLGALILPPDAPGDLRAALVGLGSETYSCASAPVQVAALTAYEMDAELQGLLAGQRRVLSDIGNVIQTALAKAGVRAHPPQGGFYLLLDFRPFADALTARGINDDEALCGELLKATGVALLPGSAFGMSAKELTARLAYVDFDGDAALLDAKDPAKNVLGHAEKMLEGIEDLRNWLLN